MTHTEQAGFMFIEIMAVFAIIMVLAGIAVVALRPQDQFKRGRDTQRFADTAAMAEAIKLYFVDHAGAHIPAIAEMNAGTVAMIGSDTTACDSQNAWCDTPVAGPSECVDLSELAASGYLAEIPVSPEGQTAWTSGKIGYTFEKSLGGVITVRACESESSDEIFLSK
jgi:type II secretory pathway pseudopilin PulG